MNDQKIEHDRRRTRLHWDDGKIAKVNYDALGKRLALRATSSVIPSTAAG